MPDEEFHYVKLKEKKEDNIKQTLGYFIIFILALNFLFDSSIFYIPQMGFELTGPSSILVWILLIIIALYVAMCFAEVIAMIPTTGGIYEISKQTYGTFTSFMTGWLTWMAGNFALLISIPAGLELIIQSDTTNAYVIKLIISIATVLFFSYLALRVKDVGSKILAYSTIFILFVFAILIFSTYIDVGTLLRDHILTTKISLENYKPFFWHEGFLSNFGYFFATIFVIATTFFGLEAVTFLSGDVKDPKKVMPKVLIWGTAIVLIVMVIFVIGSIGVLDHETYVESYIFYEDIMLKTFDGYGALLITAVVFISGLVYFSEGLGWILSGPRLIFSIAKDDFFPASFQKLDERYNAPVKAIKFQAIILSIGLLINYFFYIFTEKDPFYMFHEQLIFASLILIILLIISIPILRKKMPDAERPYKVPMGNYMPYGVAAFFIIAMICWVILEEGYHSLLITLIIITIGIPVYGFLLFLFDPEVFTNFKKTFTMVGIIYEKIVFTKKIKELLFDKVGDIAGKKVLLYGCGFGTLLIDVAEIVGPEGKVYVTDISKKTIDVVNKKIIKKAYSHVFSLHDEHHANRVHPSVPSIDIIISIGLLHHLQDFEKIVKEMYVRLPEAGRLVFKDEIDVLKFLPNGAWAADIDQAIEVLHRQGFIAQKQIVKGILVNHVFIYAMKTEERVPLI
ncbi:MAG: amino acid permease [Candidatus Woesearchaeota archaeon]